MIVPSGEALREREVTRNRFDQDVYERRPEHREPIIAREDDLVQQADDGRAARTKLVKIVAEQRAAEPDAIGRVVERASSRTFGASSYASASLSLW